jgi:hypothetical protein
MQEYMHLSLKHHIQVHHTCQYCQLFCPKQQYTTFTTGAGIQASQHWTTQLEMHEKSCKRKKEKRDKHNDLLRQHERVRAAREERVNAARDAMLLICLADKENPIATLTDDVLQCVFKHICTIDN